MGSAETDVPQPLAAALGGCIRLCEETVEAYAAEDPGARDTPFAAAVLLAAAAIRTAAETPADDPRREVSLLIAENVAREASDAVRAHGLDARLLRCAEALDRAAFLCERARR